MKRFVCLIAFVALPITLNAKPNFPFPQNAKYPYGITPTNVDNDKVQKAFEEFMKNFYEESGDLARIKWDKTDSTVSEGIGYGMIIMVYMDNATNNTQEKFDKLWNYHNKFLDKNGLMNWKIYKFSNAGGLNSATDADLDVAVGLMEAYKQWGDEKYLTNAKAIIEKISKYDVTTDGYINPGDSWGLSPFQYNPSYFSTAAIELFKQASSFDWDNVLANTYDMLKKTQNSSTGLSPDWCRKDATPVQGVYKYDAARVPWRIAWGYTWYGHTDAKTVCSKIASWITTKTSNDASKIVDGYNIDGSEISKYNNATFVGPFACAGLVDSKHQDWLDEAYTHLNTLVDTKDVYYQQSLKVMTLLLLSGNMPDLWSTTEVESPAIDAKKNINPITFSLNTSNSPELAFSTAVSGHVTISFHTLSGRLAAVPVNGSFTAGVHRIAFTDKLPVGAYFVNIQTAAGVLSKPVTITR